MWTIVPVLQNKSKKINFFKFSKPEKARVYYRDYYLNLLTGKRVPFSLLRLEKEIKKIPLLSNYQRPIVWHFFYELGHRFVQADDAINTTDVLAMQIEYIEVRSWKLNESKGPIFLADLNSVSEKDYGAQFKEIEKELLSGNIYQANLTKVFKFKHDVTGEADALDWCAHFWRNTSKIGSYAHASFIPEFNNFYFSNSPECLFQIKSFSKFRKLWSMPIKGTLPLSNSKDKNKVWQKLKSDKKNSAELLMICDLIWNDLNRIEKPWARVEKIKYPIVVNEILHQASLLSVQISKKIDFLKILSSLFPGGSITGAPKKSAMSVLARLESKRGFYCGSSLILYKKNVSATINIRSLSLDLKNRVAKYGAGGGITVHSKMRDEFNEMKLKVESFLGLN